MTKNSAIAKAVALFLAGAEGLEPSARGFVVDVETYNREQGEAVLPVFFANPEMGGADLALWEEKTRWNRRPLSMKNLYILCEISVSPSSEVAFGFFLKSTCIF